jgi:hypothetical protein
LIHYEEAHVCEHKQIHIGYARFAPQRVPPARRRGAIRSCLSQQQTNAKKRAAYEKLLTEFGKDKKTVRHIERHIKLADYWLDAPNRLPPHGYIYVAQYRIVETNRFGGYLSFESFGCFTKFNKARSFLREHLTSLGSGGDGKNNIRLSMHIDEKELDTNWLKVSYLFDGKGEIASVDYNAKNWSDLSLPENRFINLGRVFKRGDIVVWTECGITRQKQLFGVILFDSGMSDVNEEFLDWTDSSETVVVYDDKADYIYHSHPQT